MPAHIQNVRKFKKAINFVRALPPRRFDIRRFGEIENPRCGFVGCAVGWMAHEKLFRGLSLELDTSNTYPWDKCERYRVVYSVPNGNTRKNFTAVEKLFGISSAAVQYLFGNDWFSDHPKKLKATPVLVADRMQAFLETGKIGPAK